ncbi:hypothetical protein CLV48_106231 [Cecembia rubra]|uniref:Uncharacterized protein n=1 Tax=Cecembia rubra TaxID=1485585 RepID=A0A2P8E3F3_9BACT|nr:hypothetical protein CLV48_106231 [Cecembia rubra]
MNNLNDSISWIAAMIPVIIIKTVFIQTDNY